MHSAAHAHAAAAKRAAAGTPRGRVLSSSLVSRLRSLLVNLGLVLLSLAVCALVAEAAARIYAARLVRPAPVADPKPISRFHPTLGWDKPAFGEARIRRAEFDILIRINSRGLRGPDYDYAKPAGTKRVLILGDSFAEGYYVNEEETARAVLEQRLNAGPCRGWQVVNGGTIAYSTDQEYLFFSEEGHRYQPDLVTLLFYHNDLLYNASPRGPGGEQKPFFGVEDGRLVARHTTLEPDPGAGPNRQNPGRAPLRPWRGSIALRLLSNRTVDSSPGLHGVLSRLGLVQPVSNDPPREFWPYGPGRGREVEEMWATTAALLAALKQDVEAHGARLSVLYVPARFEVSAPVWQTTRERYRLGKRWDPYVVFDRLRKELDAIGVPLLDPRAALTRTEAEGPPAYYTRDVHWNAVGNASPRTSCSATWRRSPTVVRTHGDRGRFPALFGPLIEQRAVVIAMAALAAVQTVLVALRLPGWPCAFREATGIPCPGCGLSRAMAALLHGDWRTAVGLHAFAPLLAVGGLLLLAAALQREPRRLRVAERIASFESRTGLAVWLAAAFLVYWAVRLLYHPLTFPIPG